MNCNGIPWPGNYLSVGRWLHKSFKSISNTADKRWVTTQSMATIAFNLKETFPKLGSALEQKAVGKSSRSILLY